MSTYAYYYAMTKKNWLHEKRNGNTPANPNIIVNLQGVPTLQLNSAILPTCPTNIMSILQSPFYEIYTIDPSGHEKTCFS